MQTPSVNAKQHVEDVRAMLYGEQIKRMRKTSSGWVGRKQKPIYCSNIYNGIEKIKLYMVPLQCQ